VPVQERFDERMKGLNSRLAALEGEQAREEEEALDVAKRRLQVPTSNRRFLFVGW